MHPITVLTNIPLRIMIDNSDLLGQMARWAIELSEFSIQFKPFLALNGQVLTDFLEKITQQGMEPDSSSWWTLNMDGASRQMGAELGLQLKAPTGEIIEQAICFDFLASNNEVEYKAFIAEIDLAIFVSSKKKKKKSDSQLVVGQVNGEYEISESCVLMCNP